VSGRDLNNDIKVVASIAPAAYTDSVTGAAVDRANTGLAAVVITAGAIDDGTHTLTIEHSDVAGSGWATVPSGQLSGAAPVLDDETVAGAVTEVGYLGTKRFLRVVSTEAGATEGGAFAAVVILASARRRPI